MCSIMKSPSLYGRNYHTGKYYFPSVVPLSQIRLHIQSRRNGNTIHPHETLSAAEECRQQSGSLSDPLSFRNDPLEANETLQFRRNELLSERLQCALPEMFNQVLTAPFEEAILHYICICMSTIPRIDILNSPLSFG